MNPQIVENYRGGDIALGIGDEVLSPVMFPVLHQLLGQTLITTDGKTLLGADDKAGIAEIMTALAVLKGKHSARGYPGCFHAGRRGGERRETFRCGGF